MRLSVRQKEALELLADGNWKSAYDLRCSMATLNTLVRRGLLEERRGLGIRVEDERKAAARYPEVNS